MSRPKLELHSIAHVMSRASITDHETRARATFREDRNSDTALVGKRDKPQFPSFHDTARFSSKKKLHCVNRMYKICYLKFCDD
jgi:hypothetical protein